MTERSWKRGALIVLASLAAPALAHDGGFGHSRRTLYVAAGSDGLILEYRLVLNRDEALLELTRMDRDGDGTVSAAERDRYFRERGQALAKNLEARTAEGRMVPLRFVRCELNHSLTQTYHFALATSANEIVLDDRNFPHKPGLVQVRHGPGLTVELARKVDLTHAERVPLRIRRSAPPSSGHQE
jgi:hypothetical protein